MRKCSANTPLMAVSIKYKYMKYSCGMLLIYRKQLIDCTQIFKIENLSLYYIVNWHLIINKTPKYACNKLI